MNTLILHCDCRNENCNLNLVITPLGSIAIVKDYNIYLAGVHLSIEDTKKLIEQLKENIEFQKDINKQVEEFAKKHLIDTLPAKQFSIGH